MIETRERRYIFFQLNAQPFASLINQSSPLFLFVKCPTSASPIQSPPFISSKTCPRILRSYTPPYYYTAPYQNLSCPSLISFRCPNHTIPYQNLTHPAGGTCCRPGLASRASPSCRRLRHPATAAASSFPAASSCATRGPNTLRAASCRPKRDSTWPRTRAERAWRRTGAPTEPRAQPRASVPC